MAIVVGVTFRVIAVEKSSSPGSIGNHGQH